MTISSEQNRVDYAGNGATVAFAVPFRFLANADLAVALVDDTTEVAATQTIVTHYTVSGAGDSGGGTVTFVTAPATGKTVLIWGDPPLTQLVDYTAGGPLPAESHEEALDKLTLQQKRTRQIAERSIRLPDGDPEEATGILPARPDRVDSVLSFDASGDLYVLPFAELPEGPVGPQGPQGAQGVEGPQGPAGDTVTADGSGIELTASELSLELDGATLSKSATGLRLAQTVVDTIDGKAETSHTHAASEVTSGTFADARIAQTNVTQHEAAINHDALTGFASAEHIDWSVTGAETIHADRIVGGGGGGSITVDGEGLALDVSDQLSLELDSTTLSKSATGLKVADLGIANAQISTTAGITWSKLTTATANRVVSTNGSGFLGVSTITTTKLGYLTDVTSEIQAQINGKAASAHNHAASEITSGTFADALVAQSNVTQHQAAINHDSLLGFVAGEHIDWSVTGAEDIHLDRLADIADANIAVAAGITLSKLATTTANRAIVANGSGFISPSTITTTMLDYLANVTADLQGQLDIARQYAISFSIAGALTTGDDASLHIIVPIAGTVTAARACVKTAPTGANLTMQIHNVTETLDVLTSNLSITAAATTGSTTGITNGTLAVNDILRLDIDQVGSTVAGSDLVVIITVSS